MNFSPPYRQPVVFLALPASLLLAGLLAGCGPTGVYPVPVQGTVNLDGKPLDEGKIFFITPGEVPESVDIKEGKFTGKVKFGSRRVELAAYRPYAIPPEVPESMRALMKDGFENYLPEIYHAKSTLTAEVEKTGTNQFPFELQSK